MFAWWQRVFLLVNMNVGQYKSWYKSPGSTSHGSVSCNEAPLFVETLCFVDQTTSKHHMCYSMFPCLLLKLQLVWIDFELFGQHSFVVDLNHTFFDSINIFVTVNLVFLASFNICCWWNPLTLPCPLMISSDKKMMTKLMVQSHDFSSSLVYVFLWVGHHFCGWTSMNFPYFCCLISNFCWLNRISWVRLKRFNGKNHHTTEIHYIPDCSCINWWVVSLSSL